MPDDVPFGCDSMTVDRWLIGNSSSFFYKFKEIYKNKRTHPSSFIRHHEVISSFAILFTVIRHVRCFSLVNAE